MAGVGLFDVASTPLGWFSKTVSALGWFDSSLIEAGATIVGAGIIDPAGAGIAGHGGALAGAGDIPATEGSGIAVFGIVLVGAGSVAATGSGNVILGDYIPLAGVGGIAVRGRGRASVKRNLRTFPSGRLSTVPGTITVVGDGRVSRARSVS